MSKPGGTNNPLQPETTIAQDPTDFPTTKELDTTPHHSPEGAPAFSRPACQAVASLASGVRRISLQETLSLQISTQILLPATVPDSKPSHTLRVIVPRMQGSYMRKIAKQTSAVPSFSLRFLGS